MVGIMDLIIEDKWDSRHWEIAMKSGKPVETYQEMRAELASRVDSVEISELPKEEQDWLRST